jgi:hypothetical protein
VTDQGLGTGLENVEQDPDPNRFREGKPKDRPSCHEEGKDDEQDAVPGGIAKTRYGMRDYQPVHILVRCAPCGKFEDRSINLPGCFLLLMVDG